MRRQGTVCAVLLAAALTTGCEQASGGAPVGFEETSTGYGELFLGPGECSTRGRDFREVPCGSERAVARVLTRFAGPPADGPVCPRTTDFVLHVSENRPAADEDGDGAVPRGYACMRNLQPPHPGDPGGGGGPYTVVGDCLYGSRKGQVKETACDGSGAERPEYRVVEAVERRSRCPASTDLYVELGGTKPVGCAHRL
ncbi:hypothetical protein AMK26_01325 [Streptomyces sp. CB03234]|uniref:hypothetical protein n=1 Tax=Streptomyces sp. (strain CB03234) TaxID=1703937 RepID=UPI000940665E|nr:hypothetical protein [Streptomyces sp. CB03234]OKK07755.1 hypothetical protein AMK26_01325 [Streptomyces sp. CB03234]